MPFCSSRRKYLSARSLGFIAPERLLRTKGGALAAQQLLPITPRSQLLAFVNSDAISSLSFFEEMHMFHPVWGRILVVAVCLSCGVFLVPIAQAGTIVPSQIEGDYAVDTLSPSSNPFLYPWTLTLSEGTVTYPMIPPIFGFTATDLTVNIFTTSSLTLSSTLTLSGKIPGPSTETIIYSITAGSGRIVNANTIEARLSLVSNKTSPNPPPPAISLAKLNPANLILIFPPHEVKFEPSFTPPAAPVIFEIVPAPEPASIIHVIWVGLLGLIGWWKRSHRRAAAAIV